VQRPAEVGLIGQTLSHYRITAAIGAGGMGEVYRATDTNLGRDVAIKVLPAEVAQDPERLDRFQREAHLLASLNHPNIAAIYGLEEVEGKPFLALELVEGEDLKQRLERGALPVEEAIAIASQVARALEEAHDKGIVHRDLKPANVKLTPDGKVKVLDFGLAKAYAGDAPGGSAPDLSQSPTLAHTGTMAGVILGTAAYMSPEQARGQAVDKRADIWAFGVVLLEMLTGRNAFSDSTVSDTLASVLKSTPDINALPPEVPSNVRRVLERCLRKDPKQRTRDMGDVLLDLEAPPEGAGEAPPEDRSKTWGTAARWLALGAVIGGGLVAAILWFRGAGTAERPSTRTVRLEAAPPPGTRLERGLALSPDGSTIAVVARDDRGETAVWVRSLESLNARQVPGTEGARLPFWSPDGRSLGFFASGRMLTVDLVGGAPRPLAEADQSTEARGGAWSPRGTIVYSPSFLGPLMRVPADGSAPPEPATELEAGHGTHRFPHFLPDGRHFLFFASAGSGVEPGELRLGALGSLESRRLAEASSTAIYASTGHLIFARGSTMLAQPFDADRVEFTGEPVSIGIEIPTGSNVSGLRSISVSADGTLAYRADPSSATDLVWVDRAGEVQGTLATGDDWQLAPRISPDGRHVLAGRYDAAAVNAGNLWILDAERGVGTPLTFDAADDATAIWSPDGRRVVFASIRSQETFGLQIADVDAPEEARELVASGTSQWMGPDCWTPDGRRVLFGRTGTDTGYDILTVDVAEGSEPEEWLATPFNEKGADISPDGRWVAYASDIGGAHNVYVKPFEGPGTPWQVSTAGGTSPRFSPRGDEIFYRSPASDIMAVPVTASGDGFSTGPPRRLFAAGINDDWRDYDVTPDGQRFLLARPADAGDTPLVVVLGFDPTLRPASP
jgi:serine/threonine protein kinase/Tol biopolymer transport system component